MSRPNTQVELTKRPCQMAKCATDITTGFYFHVLGYNFCEISQTFPSHTLFSVYTWAALLVFLFCFFVPFVPHALSAPCKRKTCPPVTLRHCGWLSCPVLSTIHSLVSSLSKRRNPHVWFTKDLQNTYLLTPPPNAHSSKICCLKYSSAPAQIRLQIPT